MNELKTPTFFSKLVTHMLLLYPILNTYALIGSFSIGRSILMTLVVLFIFRVFTKGQKPLKSSPKYFNIYCTFWICSAIISVGFIGFSVFGALPGIIYSFLFVLLFFYETDLDYLIRWYKYYAIAFIGFLFVQESMYVSTGIRIPGIIPGLPLTVDKLVGSERYMEQVIMGYRSSSVFSEPAHFAQWLLPFLSIELMYDKNNNHYIYAVAALLSLLLLRSGNAMIGLAIVLLFFMGYLFIEKKTKMHFVQIMAFVAVLIIGGYYYLNSDIGADVLDRQDELHLNESSSDRMGQVRLFRRYYVFAEYSVLEQLIGVSDIPKLLNYIKGSQVAFFFDDDETYFNAIQSVLLKTGYIGLVIFVILCFSLSRNNTHAGKAIVFAFLALSFVAGLFFTTTMALYLVIPHKMKQIKGCTRFM